MVPTDAGLKQHFHDCGMATPHGWLQPERRVGTGFVEHPHDIRMAGPSRVVQGVGSVNTGFE